MSARFFLQCFWFTAALGPLILGAGKQDPAWIDEIVAPYFDSGNFMGVVLVAKGDRILDERAYGWADMEKKRSNLADTRFQIASLSKSFTAAGVMHLVERGKLKVGTPLAQYYPDYPRGDQLTLHHLLTHTSGIPNINSLDAYDELEQQPQSAESLVKVFKDLPLEFEPGSNHRYSNSNYVLLARLIELQGGMMYGRYLRQTFFEPLGMTQTGHPDGNRKGLEGGALGYRDQGANGLERARDLNWTVKTGNGSLYSSARDQLKWARALLSGELLQATTLQTMFKDHGNRRGYGWFVQEQFGRSLVYINGRSPGYSAFLGIFPEEEMVIVVLANTYIPIATQLGLDCAAKALNEERPSRKLQKTALAATAVSAYLGGYQFGPEFYRPNQKLTFRFADGYLVSDWGSVIAKDLKQDSFIQRRYWSDIKFLRDDKDRVVAMTFDGFRGVRVSPSEN